MNYDQHVIEYWKEYIKTSKPHRELAERYTREMGVDGAEIVALCLQSIRGSYYHIKAD